LCEVFYEFGADGGLDFEDALSMARM